MGVALKAGLRLRGSLGLAGRPRAQTRSSEAGVGVFPRPSEATKAHDLARAKRVPRYEGADVEGSQPTCEGRHPAAAARPILSHLPLAPFPPPCRRAKKRALGISGRPFGGRACLLVAGQNESARARACGPELRETGGRAEGRMIQAGWWREENAKGGRVSSLCGMGGGGEREGEETGAWSSGNEVDGEVLRPGRRGDGGEGGRRRRLALKDCEEGRGRSG